MKQASASGLVVVGLDRGGESPSPSGRPPERDSVRVYTDLIAAANREDLATAESLCSGSYTRHS